MLPKINSERWLSLEDLDGEIWMSSTLGGHEYKVSNFGRIKEPGYTCYKRARGGLHKFVIKPFIKVSKDNGKGYYTIIACRKHYYVHRVVADCFIPNLYNHPEVDHINGNRNDNRAKNLRWVNRTMNMSNPLTKVKHRRNSDSQFVSIVQLDAVSGRLIRKWDSIINAAKELGIERANISAMVRGVRGKTLKGFRFVYFSEYDPKMDYSVKYKRGTFTGTSILSDRWVVVLKSGNIEKVFSNIQTASEYYNCSFSGIAKRCREQKTVRQQKTSIANCDFRYFKDISQDYKDFIEDNISNLFIK